MSFVREQNGQSLTEHTLLIAFVAMLALSIFIAAGGHTKDIWSMGTSRLATASATNASASATPTPAAAPESGPPAAATAGQASQPAAGSGPAK